jgi:hypothetical protein
MMSAERADGDAGDWLREAARNRERHYFTNSRTFYYLNIIRDMQAATQPTDEEEGHFHALLLVVVENTKTLAALQFS